MVINNLDMYIDDKKKFHASMSLNIDENKEEVTYAQKVFNLDQDIIVVPNSVMVILKKYGIDINKLIQEKYPEDIISDDFGRWQEFLGIIGEN